MARPPHPALPPVPRAPRTELARPRLHVRGHVHGPLQLRLRQQVPLDQYGWSRAEVAPSSAPPRSSTASPPSSTARSPTVSAGAAPCWWARSAPASSTWPSASAPTSGSWHRRRAARLPGHGVDAQHVLQSYSALALIKVNSGWFTSPSGCVLAIFGSMIQSGRAAVFALMTTSLVVALPGSGASSCRPSPWR